jgi:hypothetical protein
MQSSEKVLVVELWVDDKIQTSFNIPIRKLCYSEIPTSSTDTSIHFSLALNHSRNRHYYGKFSGDIWENGREPYGLTIGIAVDNPKIKVGDRRIINVRLSTHTEKPDLFFLGDGVLVHSYCLPHPQKQSSSNEPNPPLNSDPAANGRVLSSWHSHHSLFANQFGSGRAG